MTSESEYLPPNVDEPEANSRVSRWAVWSAICALLAFPAAVGYGVVVLAVFGVGAGHIALRRISEQGGRGVILARSSLIACYALASWALVETLPTALIQVYETVFAQE